jgi:hypothetical protein
LIGYKYTKLSCLRRAKCDPTSAERRSKIRLGLTTSSSDILSARNTVIAYAGQDLNRLSRCAARYRDNHLTTSPWKHVLILRKSHQRYGVQTGFTRQCFHRCFTSEGESLEERPSYGILTVILDCRVMAATTRARCMQCCGTKDLTNKCSYLPKPLKIRGSARGVTSRPAVHSQFGHP